MLYNLVPSQYSHIVLALGIVLAYVITWLDLHHFMSRLPKDHGKALAVEGKVSEGKSTGAGVIFVAVFALCALLFAPVDTERIIYIVLLLITRWTGFLDDASRTPWGRMVKGLLDLLIAALTAVAFLYFHEPKLHLALFDVDLMLPVWLYALLIVALIWGSINVTNCSDGVDGLSATLTIITLFSFYVVMHRLGTGDGFLLEIPVFVAVLLAYLWFNAPPSTALMGDAGSRSMGYYIALCALMSGSPILFVLLALVLIIDGGLGLFKITVIRLTGRKDFMHKLKTPFHDHVRHNLGWTGPQLVLRFAEIQLFVTIFTLALIGA